MTVDPELLEILVCPETRQTLRLADDGLLAKLNARIRAGGLRNRGGDTLSREVQAGLVRQDEQILYPVDDGIPVMLVEESIELD